MARAGTIAYRTEDGNFTRQQNLKRETKTPGVIGLAFFARYLINREDFHAAMETAINEEKEDKERSAH